MKKGFAALAIVGVAAAVAVFALSQTPFSGMNLRYQSDAAYQRYLSKYGKQYVSKEEYELRKALFNERLQEILDHNAQNDHSWYMAINQFTDMLPDEINNMMGGGIDGEHRPHLDIESNDSDEPIVMQGNPVDWRG